MKLAKLTVTLFLALRCLQAYGWIMDLLFGLCKRYYVGVEHSKCFSSILSRMAVTP